MKSLILALLAPLFCFAAPPAISSFTPTSAATGMKITITGTDFTGASAVTIGGTAATSFTIISATQITATVPITATGTVQVTTPNGSASRAGFIYIPTSGIITDFGGYWATTAALPNTVIPDDSHLLLAFTHNGLTYSTGVNDGILTSNGVSFTPGSFRALPVAGVTGVSAAATSTYLALGKKVDGSANIANTPAVSSFSIQSVLSDGIRGLNLGTGITNLPASAVLTFRIANIDAAKISDGEPDLVLTQIAQPVAGNDTYRFIDVNGNVVGTSFTQDMTLLPKLGSYDLDLFNLTPNTPYNSATAYNAFATNTNREIRLIGLRLSDFGITTANVNQVKALQITPSGTSDYAFVAYNANAINLPPNVTQNATATNTTVCAGGTANLALIAAAAGGGPLTYIWEESMDGGTTWAAVSNGGSYSGATTGTLSIANAANGFKYRATATEAGNPNIATSPVFTIAVSAPAAPTAVSVSGTATTCLNNPVQLTSSVTGGSNLLYQWLRNAGGTYQDIPGATLSTYVPPVTQTGATSYKLRVSSGSGCAALTAATPATVTVAVTKITSTTPAAICNSGTATLSATATSGTIDWYSTDEGGTSLFTGTTFTTPTLAASKTYYAATGGCALRVPVTATVYPASLGGSIAGGATVSTGTNSTTLTLGGHTGSVVKWQSSTDDFALNTTDIANTTTSLTATNLTQTTTYRTVVQSGTCNAVLSSPATIVVAVTLAIPTGSLKATAEASGIRLQWRAYNQQNTRQFDVERSADGLHFSKVHTVMPAATETYSWLDANPFQGLNVYRIREEQQDGTASHSATVRIVFKGATRLLLFPNPVRTGMVQLQCSLAPGAYRIRLVNSLGQVMQQTAVAHTGGLFAHTLRLPQQTSAGFYHVEVLTASGLAESGTIRVW